MEASGTDTKAFLRDLNPLTKYNVKVSAENTLGKSDYSSIVSVVTEAEVPEEPPAMVHSVATSSHSIRVSWKVAVS